MEQKLGWRLTLLLLFSFQCSVGAEQRQKRISRRLSRRRAAIHGVDLVEIVLVHEIPLQLHGRRQLVVLRRELAFDEEETLDGLDPREVAVDLLDLALDQILDFAARHRLA